LGAKSISAKAHMAFVQLEDYVNGTLLQYQRVQEAVNKSIFGEGQVTKLLDLLSTSREEIERQTRVVPENILRVTLDTHFLVVAIDKVHKLLEYMVKIDRDPKLSSLWDEVKDQLNPFCAARNYFEHVNHQIRDLADKKPTLDMGRSTDGATYSPIELKFRNKDQSWGSILIDESSVNLVREVYAKLLAIMRARPNTKWPTTA
jgi:hypothetical protein